ncbi:MAG: integrase [Propionibacteriales bacterium]|nr:integrase [Propionibacteriales bacterium]
MARMGHDSERAALIYQHATSEADRLVAKRLNDYLLREREDADDDEPDDGAARVPARVS